MKENFLTIVFTGEVDYIEELELTNQECGIPLIGNSFIKYDFVKYLHLYSNDKINDCDKKLKKIISI
jgi:hypothetical protein